MCDGAKRRGEGVRGSGVIWWSTSEGGCAAGGGGCVRWRRVGAGRLGGGERAVAGAEDGNLVWLMGNWETRDPG